MSRTKYSIKINPILAKRDVLHPEILITFVWLQYFCNQKDNTTKWIVDFKVLSKCTQIPIKKLSVYIKHLENKELILVDRKKRTVVEIAEFPVHLHRKFDLLVSELAVKAQLKDLNQNCVIPVKEILEI